MESLDVSVFQNSDVDRIEPTADGAYRATLRGQSDVRIEFDDLIFATGFKVDVSRVPYLRSLAADIEVDEGFPVLTPYFESSSVSGLFFPGLVASRQFGPYMGFLASCPFTARTIVDKFSSDVSKQQA